MRLQQGCPSASNRRIYYGKSNRFSSTPHSVGSFPQASHTPTFLIGNVTWNIFNPEDDGVTAGPDGPFKHEQIALTSATELSRRQLESCNVRGNTERFNWAT
jgi:hypothetical protein